MGALHAGHISLINASKNATNVTICSIFVNPNQFNNKNDLEKYPKTPEKDIEMLKEAGCDVLLMPSVEEIYPQKDERVFDFEYLGQVLDGAHRPGHFNGVAQVVSRLFDIVKPHKAFFGQKDYQQALIIKALVKQLKFNIEIVTCNIVREEDGLAMSSRNVLLSAEERLAAKTIPALMQEVVEMKKLGKDISEIKHRVEDKLKANKIFKPDYFKICDAETLKEINHFNETKNSIALIACFVGKIRLIDNLIL